MAGFALQFPASQIRSLAARYEYPDGTDLLALGKAARERGHYARGELIEVCAWKTPRSRSLAAQLAARGDLPNRSSTEGYRRIRRITPLLDLRGVGVPTASTLLTSRSRPTIRSSMSAHSNPLA